MVKQLKDKNAPKRPLTSFILYGNYLRDSDANIKNLPIKEQASMIGKMWKDAAESVKEEFNMKAAKLKEEYVKMREEYEQTDEYRDFQKLTKEGSKEKKSKKKGPSKMSGYRLFVSENKELTSEDEKDPELSGKGHMVRCGIKWQRLSEEEKTKYNDKAKEMNASGAVVAEDESE